MTLNELHTRAINGEYDSKLPYDYNNKEIRKAYYENCRELNGVFKQDFEMAIETELGISITDEQFKAIHEMVYDIGHSNGYSEMVNYSFDLINVISKFVKK